MVGYSEGYAMNRWVIAFFVSLSFTSCVNAQSLACDALAEKSLTQIEEIGGDMTIYLAVLDAQKLDDNWEKAVCEVRLRRAKHSIALGKSLAEARKLGCDQAIFATLDNPRAQARYEKMTKDLCKGGHVR